MFKSLSVGLFFFMLNILAANAVVKNEPLMGSLGGGATGGGGASGGWDVVVKCGNKDVGYKEAARCADYRGSSQVFDITGAKSCRRTCIDSENRGVWSWEITECVSGYRLVKGRCAPEQKPAPAVIKPTPQKETVSKSVHGVVLVQVDGDEYEPGIGATVELVDKSKGTVADINGNFSLDIPSADKLLRVGYIGYTDKNIPARDCINGCTVKLIINAHELGEVTVTANAWKCDAKILSDITSAAIPCAQNAKVVKAIENIEQYCQAPVDGKKGFDALYDEFISAQPEQCGVSVYATRSVRMIENTEPETVTVAQRTARIRELYNRIDNLQAALGASVWKTKDGNFNGARLASDSIAGVVLGTAGGLITSNVIKKNQVKGGFENINCTVGGQVVAEWGDQFQVGVK